MNQKGITVKGCVIDGLTNTPIANARVTLLCWYHAGWDKTDYISIDTVANEQGCFQAAFEEGYKVVVASVSPKYAPALKESDEISSKDIEINVQLKQTTNAQSDIDLRQYIVEHSNN